MNKKPILQIIIFTQLIGSITLKIIALIFKTLEIIGKTALLLLFFYFTRVKKTFLRLVFFIQFIGEITLLGGFAVWLIFKNLLTILGFLIKREEKFEKGRFLINKNQLNGAFLSSFVNNNNYFLKRPPLYAVVAFGAIIFLWGIYYFYFFAPLPSPFDLERKPLPQSSLVVDRNGKLLYIAYNGKVNRIPIDLKQIPLVVRQATIAVEDEDFYKHNGISLKGITRAVLNNLKNQPTQGGSTITQQLVKIALLQDNRRVFSRKIKEAYLALLVEKAYSKDKILEMYLNNAPYGGTAYGIEAASRKYFGKKASELTLAEASLLASLPSAPTFYSPYTTEAKVYKKNQKHALEQMIKNRFITKEEGQKAYNGGLKFYSIENQIAAPHFVFWVLDQLEKEYGRKLVQEGGLLITTTLDLDVQLKAEQIVKENVEKLEKPYWISNAAALVTQPKTGEILAMVGSRDYFDEKNDGKVNVTVMKRQPGSAIKVVNYAYALSRGSFSPSSIISDTPIVYKNPWETYSPTNYDGKYRGNVTIKQALAMSLNIPAVKVLNSYGPEKMRELGIQMGIESWKDLKNYGLSLTLGGAEVKMTELATVYGIFPNLGKRKDVYGVKKVTDQKGKILANDSDPKNGVFGVKKALAADETEIIPPTTAYQITSILSDNLARLPAFGPYARLEIPGHKVAVKTGTTNNIRDNWTIGYTPDFLVATWVGNNNNKPMNPNLTSGITGAAPIWNEIMSYLLADKPTEEYPVPEGMVKVKVCAVNGLLTCRGCPKEVEEYFAVGQEPKTHCYFPTAEECQAKKQQMISEGKSADEINLALVNCPAGTTD